eukprot:CAMPEP_0179356880 /NCGR_PEP_ID=MMETSP0797-20121207/78117_1 /TAXON_ID=47934 /ORGANISM="Dinophysis acuminata, Strain DAEP01" /LENGTH=50 /DNA_ID=CAMNT_0021072073 /DNA_START=1 /DNA_END=150 /DNA_ORIENTATION=+
MGETVAWRGRRATPGPAAAPPGRKAPPRGGPEVPTAGGRGAAGVTTPTHA